MSKLSRRTSTTGRSVRSRLTGRHIAESPADHNAETAYTGAWLGVIGTALLFLTRGFDLWLVNPDGSQPRLLVTGGSNENPRWSFVIVRSICVRPTPTA